MKNFKESDFRGWYKDMDHGLLEVIEKFAESLDYDIFISPASGGIGRRMSPTAKSFHNITKYGKVQAIDLMINKTLTPDEWRDVFEKAKLAGATGIGLYPDWNPTNGVHLDVGKRPGKSPDNPAKWSAYRVNGKQKYFSIDKAFS